MGPFGEDDEDEEKEGRQLDLERALRKATRWEVANEAACSCISRDLDLL